MAGAKDNKAKTVYVCAACGAQAPKWAGKCDGCGAWNTLEEQEVAAAPKGAPARQGYAGRNTGGLITLDKVQAKELVRYSTGMSEFDRVLGGGLVAGGSVVLGGDPGAGKSTLLLQTSCLVAQGLKVFYFTGEESLEQIKDRGQRLKLPLDRMQAMAETDVVQIGAIIERERPQVVTIDSIQTMYHPELESEPGGVSQLKTCAAYLNRIAKRVGTSLQLVGHVTKENNLAGPMALMHIVDGVLMLSSTEDARYRIMRAPKNRFGSTSEIGVFAMTGTGLKVVDNPSKIFLSRAVADATGSVVTPLWEGTRPMLVEVQALVDECVYGNPRRVTIGLDDKRVAMLLAVLHKHSGLQIQGQDVYVNVVGGIKVLETGADLAVLLAAVSSFRNRIIPATVMVFGEVGLSGEVRPVQNGQERIREAAKLGFKIAVVPEANAPKEPVEGMQVVPVRTLVQAVDWVNNECQDLDRVAEAA